MKKFSSLVLVFLMLVLFGAHEVLASPPSTQASQLSFVRDENNPSSVDVSFNRGNGQHRLVVISTTAFGAEVPTDDVSYSPASGNNYSNITDFIAAGYGVIGLLSGTNESLTISGLAENTTYYVKVYEYNVSGANIFYNGNDGLNNNPRSFTTLMTINGPTLTGADQITTYSARLNWNALAEMPQTGADHYKLYLQEWNGSAWVDILNGLDVGDAATEWVVNNLDHNTLHRYWVRAFINGYLYQGHTPVEFTTDEAIPVEIVDVVVQQDGGDNDLIITDPNGTIGSEFDIYIIFNQSMEPSEAVSWNFPGNDPMADGILGAYVATWHQTTYANDTYRIRWLAAEIDQDIPVDYCVDLEVTDAMPYDGHLPLVGGSEVFDDAFCVDTEVPTFEITYERLSPNPQNPARWVKHGDEIRVTATFSEPMDISYEYALWFPGQNDDTGDRVDLTVVPSTGNMIFEATFTINNDPTVAGSDEEWWEAEHATWGNGSLGLSVRGRDVAGNLIRTSAGNTIPEGGTAGDAAALILDNIAPDDAEITFPDPTDVVDWFKLGGSNSTLNQTLWRVTGTIVDGNVTPLAGLTPAANGQVILNEYVLIHDIDDNGAADQDIDKYWNATTQTWELLTATVFTNQSFWNNASGSANWFFTFPTVDAFSNATPDGSYLFYTRGTDRAYNVNDFEVLDTDGSMLPSDPWTSPSLMQIYLDNTAPLLTIDNPVAGTKFNADASTSELNGFDILGANGLEINGFVTEEGSGLDASVTDQPQIAVFADLNDNGSWDAGEPIYDEGTNTFVVMGALNWFAPDNGQFGQVTNQPWDADTEAADIAQASIDHATASALPRVKYVIRARATDEVGHVANAQTHYWLDVKAPTGSVNYLVQKGGVGSFDAQAGAFHVKNGDVVRIDATFNEDMALTPAVTMFEATGPLWSVNPRTFTRTNATTYTTDWLVNYVGDDVSDFTWDDGEDTYGNIVNPTIPGGRGVWVTVDNTDPMLAITTPDPRSSITEALLLNQYTPAGFGNTIAGTASDVAPGQLKNIHLRVFRDINRDGVWQNGEPFYNPTTGNFDNINQSTSWIPLAPAANWSYTPGSWNAAYWSAAQRVNRAYVIEAYAEDLAGNVSSTEQSAFVIDNTPPVISVNYPENGHILMELQGSGSFADPEFWGGATDANGGTIADIEITLIQDLNCNGGSNRWFNGLAYQLAVSSVDNNDYVDVDNSLPYNSGSSATTEVEWSLDALLDNPLTTPGAMEGCYRYTIVVTDQAGNQASVTQNFIIDQTAPELALEFEVDGAITGTRTREYVSPGETVDFTATFNEYIDDQEHFSPGPDPATIDFNATDPLYDVVDTEFGTGTPATPTYPWFNPTTPNYYQANQVYMSDFIVPTLGTGNDAYTFMLNDVYDLAGNPASSLITPPTLFIDAELPDADITHINGNLVGGITNLNYGPNRTINTIFGTADDYTAGNSGVYGVQLAFELIDENGDYTGWFWNAGSGAFESVPGLYGQVYTSPYWYNATDNGPALTPWTDWTFNGSNMGQSYVNEFGGNNYNVAIHVRVVDNADNYDTSIDDGVYTGTLAPFEFFHDGEAPLAAITSPRDFSDPNTPSPGPDYDNRVIVQEIDINTNVPNALWMIRGMFEDAYTLDDIQVAIYKLNTCGDVPLNSTNGFWWDEVSEDFVISDNTPHMFEPERIFNIDPIPADQTLPWAFEYVDVDNTTPNYDLGQEHNPDYFTPGSGPDSVVVNAHAIYWSVPSLTLTDPGCYVIIARGIDRANNESVDVQGWVEINADDPTAQITWTVSGTDFFGQDQYYTVDNNTYYVRDGADVSVEADFDQAMADVTFTLTDGSNDIENGTSMNEVNYDLWDFDWTNISATSGTYEFLFVPTTENYVGQFPDTAGQQYIYLHVDNDDPTLTVVAPPSLNQAASRLAPVSLFEFENDLNGTADDGSDTWSSGVQIVRTAVQRDSDGFYWDGTAWVTPFTFAARIDMDGTTSWTGNSSMNTGFHDYSGDPGTEDNYRFTVRAWDNVNNASSFVTNYVTIDVVDPVVTVSTDNSPGDDCGPDAFIGELGLVNNVIGTIEDYSAIAVAEVAVYNQTLGMWYDPDDEDFTSATKLYFDGLDILTGTLAGFDTDVTYTLDSDLNDALNALITEPTMIEVWVMAEDNVAPDANSSEASCEFNFMPVQPLGDMDFIVGGNSIITTVGTSPAKTFAEAKSGTVVVMESMFYDEFNLTHDMDVVTYDATAFGSFAGWVDDPTSGTDEGPYVNDNTFTTPNTTSGFIDFTFGGNTLDIWGNGMDDAVPQNAPFGTLIVDNDMPVVCSLMVHTNLGDFPAQDHETQDVSMISGSVSDPTGTIQNVEIALYNVNIQKFWNGSHYVGGPQDGDAMMVNNTITWVATNNDETDDGNLWYNEWSVPVTLTELNEDGVFRIFVRATDYAGNVRNTFNSITLGGDCNEVPEFRLDNTAPVVTIDNPEDGDIFQNYTEDTEGGVTDHNGNTVTMVTLCITKTGVRDGQGDDESNIGYWWNGSTLQSTEFCFDVSPDFVTYDNINNVSVWDWEAINSLVGSINISGYYDFCVTATDLAGNVSDEVCVNVEVDFTNPTVITLNPGNFSSNIPTNLAFAYVRFSEEVDVDPSGSDFVFTLYELDGNVFVRDWDLNDIVFISPNEVRLPLTSGNLEQGTTYYISTGYSGLTNDIEDLVGNPWNADELNGNNKWRFTTISDVTPPVMEILVETNPYLNINTSSGGAHEDEIRRDQNIRISFDEKVRKGLDFSYSVDNGTEYVPCGSHRYGVAGGYYLLTDAHPFFDFTDENDNEVPYEVYFNFNGSTGDEDEFIIVPLVLLDADMTYTVSVSGNIMDLAGNIINPSVQTGTFTTVATDPTPPAIPVLTVNDLMDGECYNDGFEFSVDSDSQNPGVYSEYSVDGMNWLPFVMGDTYAIGDFTFTDGANTLYFRDAHCDNDGYAYAQVTFDVDNIIPSATITYDGVSPTNDATMFFTVTLIDAAAHDDLTFDPETGLDYMGGTYVSHTQDEYEYVVEVMAVSPSDQEGSDVTVTLLAGAIVDCAGNASTDTPDATGVFDDQAPTITIVSPIGAPNVAFGPTSIFEFNTTSANEALADAEYSWDGSTWTSVGAVASSYSEELQNLVGYPDATGEYTLYVRGWDAAGNESDTEETTFVIDVTPPDWCLEPEAINITHSTAEIEMQIDEEGTIYYIVSTSDVEPTVGDVLSMGSTVASDGDCLSEVLAMLSGLDDLTTYYVYLVAEDIYGNAQDEVFTVVFMTLEDHTPDLNHSGLFVSKRTLTSIRLQWNKDPNADAIIVAKQGTAVDFNENIFLSGDEYNASSTFGLGDDLGGNNYVVFDGSQNTVTVDGLTRNTVYHFALYAKVVVDNVAYYSLDNLTISQRTLRKEYEGPFYGDNNLIVSNLRPNPASTDITFDLEVFEQTEVRVEILNAAGRVVAVPIPSGMYDDNLHQIKLQLTNDNLASGAYLLSVSSKNGETVIVPFTIVK